MTLTTPTQVVELWNQMGMSEEEINMATSTYRDEISMIEQSFIEKLREKRDYYKRTISERKYLLSKIVEAIGENISSISGVGDTGSLKSRLNEINLEISKLEEKYEYLKEKHSLITNKYRDMCSNLGYSVDVFVFNDLSEQGIAEMGKKIDEMEQETLRRHIYTDASRESITKILDTIGEQCHPQIQEIFNCSIITEEAMNTLEEYENDLIAQKQVRISQMAEMAVVLTEKWNLLGISDEERKDFNASNTKLSNQTLQNIYSEIHRLSLIIEEKLPDLIEKVSKQIEEVATKLKFSDTQIQEYLSKAYNHDSLKITFDNLNDLLKSIRRAYTMTQPIIEMIIQREQMISDYEDLQSKNTPDLRKDNKIRWRFKHILPRHEKKLYIKLLEFEKAQGYCFQMDGIEYKNKLPKFALAPSEMIQTKRKSLNIHNENESIQNHRRKSNWI